MRGQKMHTLQYFTFRSERDCTSLISQNVTGDCWPLEVKLYFPAAQPFFQNKQCYTADSCSTAEGTVEPVWEMCLVLWPASWWASGARIWNCQWKQRLLTLPTHQPQTKSDPQQDETLLLNRVELNYKKCQRSSSNHPCAAFSGDWEFLLPGLGVHMTACGWLLLTGDTLCYYCPLCYSHFSVGSCSDELFHNQGAQTFMLPKLNHYNSFPPLSQH